MQTVSVDVTTCLLRIRAVPPAVGSGRAGERRGLVRAYWWGLEAATFVVRVLLVHWSGRGMGRHPGDIWFLVASWQQAALSAPPILEGSSPLRCRLGRYTMDNEKQPQKSEPTQEEAALLEAVRGMAPAPQRMSRMPPRTRNRTASVPIVGTAGDALPRLWYPTATGWGACLPHCGWALPSYMAQANSGRASEEGSQLRCLGGMHHRQNLISRLQDEVRTWDQECTAADDGRERTLAWQWQVTDGAADRLRLGCTCSSTKAYCPLRSLSNVIISPRDISSAMRWASTSA